MNKYDYINFQVRSFKKKEILYISRIEFSRLQVEQSNMIKKKNHNRKSLIIAKYQILKRFNF